MTTSTRRPRSALGTGVEAQALVSKVMTMQAEAGLTIAMRMPILLKGALGDRRGQREATKALTEKVSAVMESGLAASQAVSLFWWDLAFSPFNQLDMSEAVARATSNTLEPFSKRTRANAARLGSRRR